MIFGLFGRKEERATLANPATWLVNTLTGGPTASGITVNENTALNSSAVFAAVRLLSEAVASLPLHTYERQEDGKRRATEHPVSSILSSRPNDYMSSYGLRETMMGHCLMWGNGYCEIVRDGAGNPTALLPITPERVKIEINDVGQVVYVIDEQLKLSADDVLHVAGGGYDGIQGRSIITLASESIAVGMAAERFGGSFFQNGARLGGVLEHPGKMSKEASDRLRESWRAAHAGAQRAGSTALLEEGLKWSQLSISQNDAQFLETRRFQVEEIARWFGIPQHMIGSMEGATFSNIEHQQIEFVTHTLRPWLVRWEQEIKRKLFIDEVYYAEFQVSGLLRGDTRARYESYRIARESGWMSVNEIRTLEGMNAVDGGDQYIQPLNMATVADEPADETEPADRSWAMPLLEDALMRSRRVQENKERTALKRKGDHYGEWRQLWREQELPAIMIEILAPSLEAICRSYGMDQDDTDNTISETVEQWITTELDESAFAQKIIKGIQ